MPDKSTDFDFFNRLNVGWRSILSPIEGGRGENQDNYLIIDANGKTCSLKDQKEVYGQINNWVKGHIRLAVLDGLGGHANGREATEEVIQCLMNMPACHTVNDLALTMFEIHKKLHKQFVSGSTSKIPATTLTLFEIPENDKAILYHIGDSRLLKVTANSTEILTIDHVPVTQAALHGQLNEEEWQERAWHHDQNIIRQAMIMGNALHSPDGPGLSLKSDLYPLIGDNLKDAIFFKGMEDHRLIELEKDAVYLLASDGLWDREEPWAFLQQIPKFIFSGEPRSINSRVDDIVMEHVLASEDIIGGDNTTVVGFELGSGLC